MLRLPADLEVRLPAALAAVDPTPQRVQRMLAPLPVPNARLVCVYREGNAADVAPWVHAAVDLGLDVGLWALDAPAEALATWTLGQGGGGRFALLNQLLALLPDADYTVAVDDDVKIVRGDLETLLKVADALPLDLAAPAHAWRSYYGHAVTKARLRSVARQTTYVDIGPVLVVGPHRRADLLPFPDEGMGWGVELGWFDLIEQGLRMGVVDAVTVRHLKPIGKQYALDEERRRVAQELSRRGFRSWDDLERTVARHSPRALKATLASSSTAPARRASGGVP